MTACCSRSSQSSKQHLNGKFGRLMLCSSSHPEADAPHPEAWLRHECGPTQGTGNRSHIQANKMVSSSKRPTIRESCIRSDTYDRICSTLSARCWGDDHRYSKRSFRIYPLTCCQVYCLRTRIASSARWPSRLP